MTAAAQALATPVAAHAVPLPSRSRALIALVRYELAAQMRGRTLPAIGAGIALAAVAMALIGLSASGAVTVQGFGRTGISLLQLMLWVVPLIALADGALAAAELHDLESLAAQPISRGALLIGRAAGRFAGLAAALCVGLGAAGLVIAGAAGPGDAARFAGLVATALGLAAATTALGFLAGVLARSRTRALAVAVALWFVLTVGADLVAIALLSLLPRAELTWSLSGLLLLNPSASARALGAGLFGADAIAGPMGAALRRVLGPWGLALLALGLAAWTAGPLALAARVFARRDL